MTTKNKTTKSKTKSKSKSTAKKTVKKTKVITDKELGATLTEALNNIIEEVVTEEPVTLPTEVHPREYKLQRMVELLLSPAGVSLKELAETLGWLENSVRGALSAYAKKHPEYTLTSEKVEGVRIYHLKLKLFA